MNALDKAKNLLRRLAKNRVEEPAAALPTPAQLPDPSAADGAGGEEFLDLMADVGAEPTPTDTPVDVRDEQIAELKDMLASLQPLGDELAHTERQRAELALRCEELERDLAAAVSTPRETPIDPTRREKRLEKRLAQREVVLQRERARLAKVREERDDRRRVATERWHEIKALKAEIRALEQQP